MTALRVQPPSHLPRILTVRCDESKLGERCRETYAYSLARCPACGGNCVDPLTVNCETCDTTWPCAFALDDVDAALRAWSAGDYCLQAIAELVIRTGLREKLVPRYLDWSAYEFVAVPDFAALARDVADGDAHLAGSERTLLALTANLLSGTAGPGAELDLRGLWALGDVNLAAVCDSILPALRRRPLLAVAR